MKKLLNSATSTIHNTDTIAYCFKVTLLAIAIPLVCLLELTRGENTAAIPEAADKTKSVIAGQQVPTVLNKTITF